MESEVADKFDNTCNYIKIFNEVGLKKLDQMLGVGDEMKNDDAFAKKHCRVTICRNGFSHLQSDL